MALSRNGLVWLILLLIPLAPLHANDAEQRRVAQLGKMTLDQVKTRGGFAYYSGHLPSPGNFPTMYAHSGNAITVIGRGFMREYSIKDWQKAVDAYRALLLTHGYDVSTER